jgi:hypothetical protein
LPSCNNEYYASYAHFAPPSTQWRWFKNSLW